MPSNRPHSLLISLFGLRQRKKEAIVQQQTGSLDKLLNYIIILTIKTKHWKWPIKQNFEKKSSFRKLFSISYELSLDGIRNRNE